MRSLILPLVVLAAGACSSSTSSSTPSSSGQPQATPKFKEDVNPLLSQSCALSACHGSSASNLGIFISFDAAQVYSALQQESPTAKGMKFVVPGDPKNSYLQLKIDGTQAQAAAKCGQCGAQMPLDLPPLSQAQRDMVRAWIQAGAKND